MNEQLEAMSAAITKADIAMKSAAWQIQAMNTDMEMLRKLRHQDSGWGPLQGNERAIE